MSDDGKFVTNRSLVEGGVNAIATTSDKKIHNVAGVLAESSELDLALLKAETKQVPFLPLNNVATPERGARVTIVRSPMTGREGTNSDTEIAARRSDEKGEWLDLSTPPANETSGSPVVNETGDVIGIVTLDPTKSPATNRVLSASALQSFPGQGGAGGIGPVGHLEAGRPTHRSVSLSDQNAEDNPQRENHI